MEEELKCGICLDIAVNAVETSCCNHIYCQKCLTELTSNKRVSACPECRSELQFVISKLARRMIGYLPISCSYEGCDTQTTRSNLEDHKNICEYREFNCIAPNCQFNGKNEEFLNHLVSVHKNFVLKNSEKLFLSSDETELDRIAIRNNSSGNPARLGKTGKYYCGYNLDFTCVCCVGCGPGNGCNCTACMKLDIEVRGFPTGYLVNKEGFACRKSTNGEFYCGRKMEYGNAVYCGPTNGLSCQSCDIINKNNVYEQFC